MHLKCFNVEWWDSIICLANFYDMLMIDIINKMLLSKIINLESINSVNKFTLSIMRLIMLFTFIYCVFIVFCCFCYRAILPLCLINNILKTNVLAENY